VGIFSERHHLLDRHPVLTVTGDPHDIVTELSGVGPGHSNILPARPSGQANSDVTCSCSRPSRQKLTALNRSYQDVHLRMFTHQMLTAHNCRITIHMRISTNSLREFPLVAVDVDVDTVLHGCPPLG
jgi:hypothetical protein